MSAKARPYIPEGMRDVCFECGERGHFGRDCPVRKANDGRRGKGKKRVRFDAAEAEAEADDDDESEFDPLGGRRRRRGGLKEEVDDEDEDEMAPFEAQEVDGDENVASGGGDEDEDEDDAPVRRNNEAVAGEEDETGEKYNEVGERIEPFNLRSERANDGFFDQNGNFVWHKGNEEPDEWLAGMDEETMEAAVGESLARKARAAALEADVMDEDEDEEDGEMTAAKKAETLLALARLLRDGEKVAAGVRRLGRALKAKDPGAKDAFEALTSMADALVGAGRADVYECAKEDLERAAAASAPPPVAAPVRKLAKDDDVRQWEYRAADGKTYGPYPTQTILDWQAGGFFTGDAGVPMREYVAPPPPKAAADELANDLEDSDDDEPAPAADHNPNRWAHSDDIDFLGDGTQSPLP